MGQELGNTVECWLLLTPAGAVGHRVVQKPDDGTPALGLAARPSANVPSDDATAPRSVAEDLRMGASGAYLPLFVAAEGESQVLVQSLHAPRNRDGGEPAQAQVVGEASEHQVVFVVEGHEITDGPETRVQGQPLGALSCHQRTVACECVQPRDPRCVTVLADGNQLGKK